MKKQIAFVAPAVAVLALAACSSNSSSSSSSASASSTAGVVTVQLNPLNNSGVTGSATLTPQGNETLVTLNLTGEPDGAYEPAHIHLNYCANIDPNPEYFLTDSGTATNNGTLWVQNGKATALVNVPLSDLQKTPHSINVHLSPTNLPHYMACGDIPAA